MTPDTKEFEEHLGELMRSRVRTAATPFTPDAVARAAEHRRSRVRFAGIAAGALAVAAIGTTAAMVAGHHTGSAAAAPVPTADPSSSTTSSATTSPAPSATTSTASASSHLTVAPGQKITVLPGVEYWVTTNEFCVSAGSPAVGDQGGSPVANCRTTAEDHLDRQHGPNVGSSGLGASGETVVTGMYLGPTVPARVTIEIAGRTSEAVVVTTAGMQGWSGFYAVVPVPPAVGVSRPGPPAIFHAYDAEGKVLLDKSLG